MWGKAREEEDWELSNASSERRRKLRGTEQPHSFWKQFWFIRMKKKEMINKGKKMNKWTKMCLPSANPFHMKWWCLFCPVSSLRIRINHIFIEQTLGLWRLIQRERSIWIRPDNDHCGYGELGIYVNSGESKWLLQKHTLQNKNIQHRRAKYKYVNF